MSTQTKKPKRVTILDVRKVAISKGPKAGTEARKVQFAKGIEILYNGEKLDLGEYNSGFLKMPEELEADINFLLENEYINSQEAEKRRARLQEKNISGELQVSLK